jgi:hypothetical protein
MQEEWREEILKRIFILFERLVSNKHIFLQYHKHNPLLLVTFITNPKYTSADDS